MTLEGLFCEMGSRDLYGCDVRRTISTEKEIRPAHFQATFTDGSGYWEQSKFDVVG
jgi:hypothetical protein